MNCQRRQSAQVFSTEIRVLTPTMLYFFHVDFNEENIRFSLIFVLRKASVNEESEFGQDIYIQLATTIGTKQWVKKDWGVGKR